MFCFPDCYINVVSGDGFFFFPHMLFSVVGDMFVDRLNVMRIDILFTELGVPVVRDKAEHLGV